MTTLRPDRPLDRRELLGQAAQLAFAASALPLARRRATTPPDLGALQRVIDGGVVRRGAAGYGAARLLYSPRFDATAHPLAIVYCESAADVRKTIVWARENHVPIAARSGGHSYAGYSSTTGIVVDVSRLSSIRVDLAAGTASIGAGARLMDIYRTLAAHGVTVPGGTCPSVGIAGLTLGGGIGYSGRKLGLTCDNLRSLTIVTADGVVRTCSARHNPDLFWACRGGGGGNFGIATRFTFATHPVDTVTIYRAGWDWANAASVVRAWQAWAPTAPDALFSLLDLEARDSGEVRVGSSGQLFGSATELQALLAPFFAAGAPPATLEIRTLPYLDAMLLWAGCSDALHCRLGDGVARSIFAARSDYVAATLPDAGLDRLLRAVEARAAAKARSAVLLDASGGAINRVSPGATAFVHRRMAYSCQYVAGWNAADGAAGDAAARSWLRRMHAAMRPFVSGQAYQNYIDPELPRWGLAYYGSNYARLRRIKRRYDPRNVFRFAQSIVPARGPRVP